MNQNKTFIILIISACCLWPCASLTQLERTLTSSEVAKLRSNIASNPENIKSRLFLASHFYKQKKWDQVIAVTGPFAEKLPESALVKLSLSYLAQNNRSQSQAMVELLLAKESKSIETYQAVADIYTKLLEVETDAVAKQTLLNSLVDALKLGLATYPQHAAFYEIWITSIEKYSPHYAFEALRVLEDMKKAGVTWRARHYTMACKFNFVAEYAKQTEESCRKAIIKDRNEPSNYIYLGQTKVNLGDEKEGKRMLASVGNKFSGSEDALYATATSFFDSKNYGDALTYYKKATEHKDSKPRDFLGLAKSAFELKQYQVSLNNFIKHCKMSGQTDQEFRKATGLLSNDPNWQRAFRLKMTDCVPLEQ